MMHMESKCTRCGEIFIPHSTKLEDLIHGETEMGKPCGGIGVIMGLWLTPGEERDTYFHSVVVFERHGKDNPHCDDPDCEFHHPELIEL